VAVTRTLFRRLPLSLVLLTVLTLANPASGWAQADRRDVIKHFTVSTDSGPLFITGGPACGLRHGPTARAVDCDLWFTEFGGRKVGRMTRTGQITEFPATGTLPASSSGGWITVGPDGNLWSTLGSFPLPTYSGAAIVRTTPAGKVTVFPLPDGSSGPNGIITGPDGNLWFTEINAQKIGRITPAGRLTEFSLPAGIPAKTGPHEITAGPDGNLWFTIPGANQVARMTARGVVTEFQLPPPPTGTYGAAENPPTRRPASITVGPDGNLWFTERDSGRIGRMTPAGSYTDFSLPYDRGSAGMDMGEIGAGDDAIWFTEQHSKCIGRITPDGAVQEFADSPAPTSNPGSNLTVGPDGDLWFNEWVFQSPSDIIARMNPKALARAGTPCPPPASVS
jgi:streptogramin lyase